MAYLARLSWPRTDATDPFHSRTVDFNNVASPPKSLGVWICKVDKSCDLKGFKIAVLVGFPARNDPEWPAS